jgi:hypothetical protein
MGKMLKKTDQQTIHKFSTGPPNDHSCKVTIQLAWWFLIRRFVKFQPMRTHYGPWQLCKSSFVLFLAIVLYVLPRFMDSDYPFGIFKLFLLAHHVSFCHGSASVVLPSVRPSVSFSHLKTRE